MVRIAAAFHWSPQTLRELSDDEIDFWASQARAVLGC